LKFFQQNSQQKTFFLHEKRSLMSYVNCAPHRRKLLVRLQEKPVFNMAGKHFKNEEEKP